MIIPSSGYCLSGIRAAFRIMDASAHNTANMRTDGFKKTEVRLTEGPAGGVAVNAVRTNGPGITYTDHYGITREASNTDYTEEALNQMTARHLMTFNAAALKTADEMTQTIIDILA